MVEEKAGIKVEKSEESAGISIKATKGELKPPLEEGKVEEPQEEIKARKVITKLPLHPAVVKPPLRFEGLVLSELTGYPGWIYTEEDLEDLAALIAECGLEASPVVQVLIALITLHGAKFTGYVAWRRKGKPGDLKKAAMGEMERAKRPESETIRG